MEPNKSQSDVGIIFIGPIVGLRNSLIGAFKPIEDKGVPVIGVDLFGDYEKRSAWKVLGLTMLPGSHNRRVAFANRFPEHHVFAKIKAAADELFRLGKKRIILGGMSGGLIYASRIMQDPPDQEIEKDAVLSIRPSVVGIFGISPLIFYPAGVHRLGADINCVPHNIPILLFFGDNDTMIPQGTIEKAEAAPRTNPLVRVVYLKGEDFGAKKGSIKHQFFGGKDFVGPIKNAFWHEQAERKVIEELRKFISKV